MPNKHIKTINGRKYYYESIRIGKKVTSRYLGPVYKRLKKRDMEKPAEPEEMLEELNPEDLALPDDAYIG